MINNASQETQQSQNNITNDNDDSLIDAYIGKNADKLKNTGFSYCTLFFGFIYTFYRKMWSLGIIWLAINALCNVILPGKIVSIVDIVATVTISSQFKKMYLKNVKEKINKIKAENPDKSNEELIAICREKGGTTIIPIIIVIVLCAIIALLATLAVLGNMDEIRKRTQENYNNSSINIKTSRTIGNLNVTIPDNLVESSDSTNDFKSYNLSYDNADSCSLYLSVINADIYNNDAKDYLEKNISYSANDTYSGVSQKAINNNTWYYASVTNNYIQEYFYSVVNNDYIYKLEFTIYDDTNKTCSSAYNTVINSLRFD